MEHLLALVDADLAFPSMHVDPDLLHWLASLRWLVGRCLPLGW
jgi:hypothetical protein